MIALVLLSGMLAGAPALVWTRDYTKAFGDAEEQGRPVLLFFRNNCGGGNTPVNPITADRPIDHQGGLSPCDRMQEDVWENEAIESAAGRYVAVIVDGGDATLETRYQAVRMPTTLVTDPWGNEIFRTTGYLPRDKIARILDAVPHEFSLLSAAGRTLKRNPTDFGALVAAAAFYEGAGLPQVSDRLYERALNAPGATDVTARRQAVISRGLALMGRLGRGADAVSLFQKELAAAPDGPGSDALLLGLVNAHLTQGHRKEAEAAVEQMEQRFPASPYTARAKQNLTAARK